MTQKSCAVGMRNAILRNHLNVLTRGLFAGETMHAIVQRLENLNIKRNMTSMFVNKKHRYCEKLHERVIGVIS